MYHLGEKGQWYSRFHRLATIDRMVLLKILLYTESEMVVQWGENTFHIFLDIWKSLAVNGSISHSPRAKKSWINHEFTNAYVFCICEIYKIGYDCDRHRISVLMVIYLCIFHFCPTWKWHLTQLGLLNISFVCQIFCEIYWSLCAPCCFVVPRIGLNQHISLNMLTIVLLCFSFFCSLWFRVLSFHTHFTKDILVPSF